MPKLLVTNKKEEAKQYIEGDIEKIEGEVVNIDKNADISVIDKKQVKVDDIRDIIKTLSTKPLSLKQKYLVIFNFDKATISSQNAFLKTLEEGKAQIYLQVESSLNLLDTIISRAQVINLTIERSENTQLSQILEDIIKKSDLGQIPSVVKKYEAGEIYNNLEIVLSRFVKTNSNIKVAINDLYLAKKRQNQAHLNTEIQITYIIIRAIDSLE